MRRILILFVLTLLCFSSSLNAEELLSTSGPQEYEGVRYYWLAEWKLEITIPEGVAQGDRLELLFGTKGTAPRTLHYEYGTLTGSLSEVRSEAYEWIPLPIDDLTPGAKVVLSGKGREQVAFIAGVRITNPDDPTRNVAAPKVKPIALGPVTQHYGEGVCVWSDLPGFEMNDDFHRLWNPSPEEPDWARAERSSIYAGTALSKVQRWLHERCMAVHDERSGLFRPTGPEWNYRDTAADCYPFYVWAAFYTEPDLLETVMLETLEAEQRLCNHLDRLPVPYNMDTQQKRVTDFDPIIFSASEYAKDGLTPIVEVLGPDSPWAARMQSLVDDIFLHARIETPYGMIPSTNVEVNGELLQLLPRLYGMTGDPKYLDWAHRLADYYLLPGGFVPTRLSDHGCEIVGGLGLLFAIDVKAAPEKADAYRPHLEYLYDTIIERGTNSDGVIIGAVQGGPGPHDNVTIRDGWGYDFVGFLDYDLALGTDRYSDDIERAMSNLLKPRYVHFNWDHGSRDNLADSVEGGLYLLHRIPVDEGFVWADREMATCLVDHTDTERLWGTHKLEANTVRSVLIHTMLHTRNTIARPWTQGLQLGAAPCGDGICIHLESDEPYEGVLQFDIPRHRLYMGFDEDWPRMNAVPEWFTVEPNEDHLYDISNVDNSIEGTVPGLLLSEGLPISLEPGVPVQLIVRPQ
jgi:hypothetical protein